MGLGTVIVVGLVAALFLKGCSKETSEESEERYTIEDIEDELKTEEANDNTKIKKPAVAGATVVCTSMTESESDRYMVKEGAEISQGNSDLNAADIKFNQAFIGCKYLGQCKADNGIEIEDEEWKDCDEDNLVAGKAAVIEEQSYMFCCNGRGMLYISDSGQQLPELEGLIWERQELVTLADLDAFGFYMGEDEEERLKGLSDLNRVLKVYGIDTDLRVAFFMGQVFKESRGGLRTLEGYNGDDPEAYFNNKYDLAHAERVGTGNLGGADGSTFRGSGYLQITGRANYKAFAEYIGNEDIAKQGYALVGGVYNKDPNEIAYSEGGGIDIGDYAWEASGWFWKMGNPDRVDMNVYADDKDYVYILQMINSKDGETLGERNRYINEFYRIKTGQELGLPEE